MKQPTARTNRFAGFSLGEMLAALVIGAMVLTAILGVYARANRAADAVLAKVESPSLATEVLHLLAEDLDRLLGAEEGETSIKIEPGFDNGFARSRLTLRRTYRDAKNEEKAFEEITWLAGYDHEGSVPGLMIYRGHEGMNLEDKLLDAKREGWEDNYPLIPICRGVTFFRIEVPKDKEDEFVDRWAASSLPPGVRVTISFAEPYETVRGTWDVLDQEKVSRTIAIDRTRAIKFTAAKMTLPGPGGEEDEKDEAADEDEKAAQPTEQKADEKPTPSTRRK
ncbi:MAG: prepilin-type N-terminal cleavage/methylation domain-containing protein [Sedimentisphaerales bacterium]|nr:prepilin-type N-terminal cleavage/methylation domain-containing protein [Sedimentisphaerales bacterium]